MKVDRGQRALRIDTGDDNPIDVLGATQENLGVALVELEVAMCVYPGHGRRTLDGIGGHASVGSHDVDSGITRKIDDLGRIVIPAETRRMFNIREGDHLYVAVEGGNIVLRKMTDSCTFCGSDTNVTQFKGKGVCASCKAQLES